MASSSLFTFVSFQLQSSSSDEAISSSAGKGQLAVGDPLTEEGTPSSRVSIEIEEEEAEKIRKAQTKIK